MACSNGATIVFSIFYMFLKYFLNLLCQIVALALVSNESVLRRFFYSMRRVLVCLDFLYICFQ